MFQTFAPEYIEKNLFVIPLKGKIPQISKWTKIQTESTYESWFKKYKNYNIGLLLGENTGVVALDIDKESAIALCPESPVVKKGKKGETRFYKYTGELSQKNHDVGIELLSTGNQTVLPPSIHPDGGEYVWTRGDLLSFDVDDLPEIPKEFIDKHFKGSTSKKGRHDSLLSMCFAMLKKGDDYNKIAEDLYTYDQKFHIPPWFTDTSEPHKGDAKKALEKFIKSAHQTFKSKGGVQIEVDVNALVKPEEYEINHDIYDIKEAQIDLPSPTGVLKDIYECILKHSHKPRPRFALAAAHQFVGVLLSNKVRFENCTPNLYQILVTESGEGKDVPLKAPARLLESIGYYERIGLTDYRSDKQLIRDLKNQRVRIDTIDEMSKVFKAVKNASGPMAAVPEILTELWNAGTGLFLGHKGMDISIGACFNPCLSLFGAGTPSAFEKYFSAEQVMQGFGARFMYIHDNTRVKPRRASKMKPSKSIVDFANFWKNIPIDNIMEPAEGLGLFEINLEKNRVAITELDKPLVPEIKASEAATEMLDELVMRYDEEAQGLNASLRALKHRCIQHVETIMIHSAACNNPTDRIPMIDTPDVEYAVKYVEATYRMAEGFFNKHLAESWLEGTMRKVYDFILDAGLKGTTKSEITRAFRSKNLRSKQVSEYLTDMMDEGILGCKKVPTNTKSKNIYFVTGQF